MGTLHNIDDAYAWSISRIAEAFGLDRRTVSAKIKAAHIEPTGVRKGHPTYHLSDIGPALFGESVSDLPPAFSDPAIMLPKDRKDWYQSERERLKLETELKELAPADEVARGYADLVKAVINPLDSLIDVLEIKAGLSGDSLERVQVIIDNLREEMYLRAIKGGANLEADPENE